MFFGVLYVIQCLRFRSMEKVFGPVHVRRVVLCGRVTLVGMVTLLLCFRQIVSLAR